MDEAYRIGLTSLPEFGADVLNSQTSSHCTHNSGQLTRHGSLQPPSSWSLTSTHRRDRSMSTGQRKDWPPKLDGRAFKLTRLKPEHVASVWPQLYDPQNARLFRRVYGFLCSAPSELEAVINDEIRGRTGNVSYAICTAEEPQKPIGWIVLYNMNIKKEGDVLDAAFFLSYKARTVPGGRSFFPICIHAFEVLGYKSIEYWWGSLRSSESKLGPNQALGLSLSAVLSRQLLVAEEPDGDHYLITVEQWRAIKPNFDAWDASLCGIAETR